MEPELIANLMKLSAQQAEASARVALGLDANEKRAIALETGLAGLIKEIAELKIALGVQNEHNKAESDNIKDTLKTVFKTENLLLLGAVFTSSWGPDVIHAIASLGANP